jgi:diguanylate cyclase (GGDEF)-like protein/PAS domain S-box-containing protein
MFQEQEEMQATSTRAYVREPIRILLLEDNPCVVELIRHYLRCITWVQHSLTVAVTMHEAAALLERQRFDLAIADLNLPDSSGLDTVKALAGRGDSQIIVVTGDDDPGLREASIASGAYEFLHKGRLNEESLQRLVRLAWIHANTVRSLRESEKRFSSLAALSSDLYWEQDEQYRFTHLSEKSPLGQSALGTRRWELPWFNMTEADWAPHRAKLDARRAFSDLELGKLDSAGEQVWLSISGEPVFKEGQFVGYRGIGRDITARKREERLLRLEQSTTRVLANAEPHDEDAIRSVLREICESEGWTCGRFFRLNEDAALVRLAATWSAADTALDSLIDGSGDFEFSPGEGLIGHVWQSMQTAWVADSLADQRIKLPARWLQGGLRSAFAFPVLARDQVMGVIAIASNIIREPDERLRRAVELIGSQVGQFLQRKQSDAARREVERRFRQTFELAGSGIAHITLDGRFLSVNRKICRILGRAEAELLGQPLLQITHPQDMDAAKAQHAALVAGEADSIHVERRYLRTDGTVVWVDLTMALARDEAGNLQYEIAVMEDITSRKRAEQLRGLEHKVNRYLADAGARSDALRLVMQAICETEDWDTGRYFELDETAELMRFRESWWANEDQAQRWTEASRSFSYRRGHGLVGTAWDTGRPLWVSDMTRDPRVAHPHIAQQTGMHASFNFPIAFEGRTIGVISITSRHIREPDEPLLQALGVIGRQVGQYLLRRRSEDSGRRFRAALDAAADMVFLVDLRTACILDFNATASRYLGYEPAELLGCQGDKILEGASLEDLRASQRALLANKDGADSHTRKYRRKDGSTFEAEVLRRIVESPEGPILVVNARDLTERKTAEARQSAHLRYQEKIFRLGQSALGMREPADLVLDAAQSALAGLNADAVAYVEPGPQPFTVILREVLGLANRPLSPVAAYGSDEPLAAVLQRGEVLVLGEGERAPLPFNWASAGRTAALVPVQGERTVRGALCALSRYPGAFGSDEIGFIQAVASVLSTGLQRIDSEGRLAFLAQFDALTGLPNRSLLSDRFSQMIMHAQRNGTQLGVLFIDLDDFKLVNDTLGHAGGDELLKEVADRLRTSVRAGDTVARISGDEFSVVLSDLSKPEDAALVAQKIIDALAVPAQARGQEVFVSASIGIAVYPTDGQDAEALLGAADAAMYRAKQSQRNAYQFFTPEINQRSRARAQLGSELHRALERDEFRLFYQPKIDLRSGRACGAEALLRWKHPERGLVAPAEFIPVLEETGLIVSVGEWVVRQACEDLRAWAASALPALPVAVNLSARQFRQPDLDVRIRSILAEAGTDCSLLELEITESQLMHDPSQAIRVLRTLREAGLRIAIDDFGTGYSSLAYLTRFPLSALKIDRSFVADVLNEEAAGSIVRTIVDMAKTLGLTVIAEGVENEAQAAFLRALGCHQAQGYFFAKPMPAAELGAFLARGPA